MFFFINFVEYEFFKLIFLIIFSLLLLLLFIISECVKFNLLLFILIFKLEV